MRIGLYGGSFDPVHIGHLVVAQTALEELQLDLVCFIPASKSPFKPESTPAPGNERARLLRLALAGCTQCIVDTQELDRGGVSYSIDTLRHYSARYPNSILFYLIGADQVTQLHTWRDAGELARLAEFIVIPRPNEPSALPAKPFQSRSLRGIPVGVSSSDIRNRISAGLPVDLLVGKPVAEAIANSGLYSNRN